MNGPLAALLAAARTALAGPVRAQLQGDQARAQLAAVIETLAKLEPMVDWSAAIRAEQQAALRAGLQAFAEGARALGLQPPAPSEDADEDARACSDWLFAQVPAGPRREALDTQLRGALRAAVAAERRHIPRTDFSTMTEPQKP